MNALTVSNAAKEFQQEKQKIRALDGVSFEILPGEIFGLLGPNGAGKTTLISAICGLLELDSGKIEVFGKDAVKQRSRISQEINLVTGFAGLLRELTVEDLLYYYSLLYSLLDKEKAIQTVLEKTGLEQKRKQVAHNLSSGYRQRFYIAKALLNNPKLLLMDEPTVGLDVASAYRIRALIRELKKNGTTILLTTHYMQEAEQLCDRIALINHGQIIACGTMTELRKLAGKKGASLETVFLRLTNEDFVEEEADE